MNKNYIPILLATALALIALLISQTLWLQYASKQDTYEQNRAFLSSFSKSISSIIRRSMDSGAGTPVTIKPIDSLSFDKLKRDDNPKIVDAGKIKDAGNVAIMIENALIALKISEGNFNLAKLDTLLTTRLNERGSVVSSHITLEDTKEKKLLDEVQHKHIATNSPFFIKSYTAERKIEIPDGSYLLKAEYRIKQSSYLQRLGYLTNISFIASIIIIVVLFYLLRRINRSFAEIANMERSFHGAIHDLKSPLAYVFFQLSLMEEEEPDLAKKSSLSLSADRVSFLSDKIMRLLKSAKNIRKIEEKDKEDVSLYDMLEQIECEMQTMFPKKKSKFNHKIDADFTMHVLPDLMEASLRIIIENAVKYSGDLPIIDISAIRDIENIKVYISDNGVGMNKQQLKNIFRPYYTSDKAQGNGIGLYYAQSIVKAHGGNISVTSNAGKGSTFLITLPIS